MVGGWKVLGQAPLQLGVALHLLVERSGGVVADAVGEDVRVRGLSGGGERPPRESVAGLLGDQVEVVVGGGAVGEGTLDVVVRVVPGAPGLLDGTGDLGRVLGELAELRAPEPARLLLV